MGFQDNWPISRIPLRGLSIPSHLCLRRAVRPARRLLTFAHPGAYHVAGREAPTLMHEAERQLEIARGRLLDLSLRNRLLNFRPTRRRSIGVVDEVPAEVYDILVLSEKSMQFRPGERAAAAAADDGGQPPMPAGAGEGLPQEPAGAPPPGPDRFLQTALPGDELQQRLYYLYQESASSMEEAGYSILYLAVGFLEWQESDTSADCHRAPLVLIPVELERAGVRTAFSLRWSGEDVSTNISLQAAVARQGVLLPDFEMPEDKDGINEYFQAVSRNIAERPRWRVVTDIYLGFFSFRKFTMYRDLDTDAWPEDMSPAGAPLIRALFDPGYQAESAPGFDGEESDEKLRAADLYHIVDADPSQIAAIEDIKAGRNLVVEGPPGTGKSQTIANVVAESLAAGRSVLFVSEKMAALEVVKARLDQAGIGDFCLQLHSHKSNKREVLEELRRTLELTAPGEVHLEEEFDRLDGLRSELNGYARDLREPWGHLTRSPFDLYCAGEAVSRHFEAAGRPMPAAGLSPAEGFDQKQWTQARAAFEALGQALPLVSPVSANPWLGCRPACLLPSDVEEVRDRLARCAASLRRLDERISAVAGLCAAARAEDLEGLGRTVAAAEIMAASVPLEAEALANPKWAEVGCPAREIVGVVELVQAEAAFLRSRFREDALDRAGEIAGIHEEYARRAGSPFRFLSGRYRDLNRRVAALYRDQAPGDSQQRVADVGHLRGYRDQRQRMQEADGVARSLFGRHWQAEASDPALLRRLADWVPAFRQALSSGALTEGATALVAAGLPAELRKEIEALKAAGEAFSRDFTAVVERIAADCAAVFGGPKERARFADIGRRLEAWSGGLAGIDRWGQFIMLRDRCLETVGSPVVDLVMQDRVEPADLVPCFEGNLVHALLRQAFDQRPHLASFFGLIHEKKMQDFADLDRRLIAANRRRLQHKLWTAMPRDPEDASPGSAAGILQGELRKTRRHMPIRKLLFRCGGHIQKIKPCFMMSPLSIAQFLDPRSVRFDLILFDEASQVRPEDALGALLRARQVVVMGDRRQLPPTTFFDRIVHEDEDDLETDEATVGDMDSILDQCATRFPSRRLIWHYRSRHESLIAVSNQEFYENRLLVYPSAVSSSADLGLHLVHVPGAVYDRGRGQVNRQEARVVAEAVVEHFRRCPGKSLGVGAFSIKQQQAIDTEIELMRRRNPGMDRFFARDREEHFFVKNLETIQGDERDVIFLSIGYGFDAAGVLTHNFGPLNQMGGERRLNVLITRAREKCVVFSSFRGADLSLEPGAQPGPRALKAFLEYAENRTLASVAQQEGTASPFEDAVFEFLRARGHEVRRQVGCARFRVDLGIVDPRSPGRYLLGIEGDGAQYHSSRVARDRDRLRDTVLRDRGWRVHHAWSTDWYRRREEGQRSLLEAIERAAAEPVSPLGSGAPPPAETGAPPMAGSNTASPPGTGGQAGDGAGKEESAGAGPAGEAASAAADGRGEDRGASEAATSGGRLEEMVYEYEACRSLGVRRRGELHEQTPAVMALAVENVVVVEGPVCLDEVARRIRLLWNRARAGDRTRQAIEEGVRVAVASGRVVRREDFLWPPGDALPRVRRRLQDPPARIALICDEEIAEAVKLVVRYQSATLPDDLSTQASRLLGMQSTPAGARDRIEAVIQGLLQSGVLQELQNGMIDLGQDSR